MFSSMLQIHIAGPQRSGKSELARRIASALVAEEHKPVIIDIDETRSAIFPQENTSYDIGDDLNRKIQFFSYNAIHDLRVPDVLKAGGVPIVTATHANEHQYPRAVSNSKKLHSRLRFILLEPATDEEVDRRAKLDVISRSDIRDLTDSKQLAVYKDTVARFYKVYRDSQFEGEVLWIPQGRPENMFSKAWAYLVQ
jgi:hypothetical protein